MYRQAVIAILSILGCTATLQLELPNGGKSFNPIEDVVTYDDEIFNITAPTPQERAERAGYTAETHEVVTDDGYILQMHRITGSQFSPRAKNKPVVFLMHGLLDCGVTWVIEPPEKSLAFKLADKGYDVWIGNARGSRYSRKHEWLTTHDKEYWSFSWHETGVFDLPAMIDNILKVTKQKKLIYVGHSQGCIAFFVMASLRREYQRKIEAMFALAPAVFMSHSTLPLVRIFAPIAGEIMKVGDLIGWYEFMPSPTILRIATKGACPDSFPFLCGSTLSLLLSPGERLMNETVVAEALQYFPAGASTRQLVHYAQSINTGRFCQYDHGLFENLKRYGSIAPPDYPIERIKIPIYLHYGNNDGFVNVKDVDILYKKLPNCQKFLVPEPSFTHIDFVWAASVDTLVYNIVLSQIAKHT